jgi:RimJ/RimL family protein N-acetyltransferase
VGDELRTPRLRLRRWRRDDTAVMAAINRDPEVTRFLNRDTSSDAIAAFLPRVEAHWEQHGFGFWAVELLDPGDRAALIGFAGVGYPDFLPDLAHRPELGWRLARDAWGRGLGTEAAAAARDDAFGRLRLESLISIIHPVNRRSRRIAVKLGMALETSVHHPALDRDVEVWCAGLPR